MYQKINFPDGTENAVMVKRMDDASFIPFDPANTDYQEYLKWVAEGNTPSPAESVDPQPADEV